MQQLNIVKTIQLNALRNKALHGGLGKRHHLYTRVQNEINITCHVS